MVPAPEQVTQVTKFTVPESPDLYVVILLMVPALVQVTQITKFY